MAATFEVEDGTGKADANAYCTEAYGLQYVEDHRPAADLVTWNAAAQADHEGWIRDGTRYVERKYGTRWTGVSTNETQALAFPMTGIEDFSGYSIDDDEMPDALLRATMEATCRSMNGTDLLPDEDTPGDLKAEAIKLGKLAISSTYSGGGQSALPRFATIDYILQAAGLITPGGVMERA